MKTQTSSKKKKPPRRRTVKLFDGTVVETNNNKAPHIKKGKLTKHIIPKEKMSTELPTNYENHKIKDDYDKLKFPPPSKHPVFREFWAEAVGNLSQRENFESAHLGLLEVLCRMKVELRKLDEFIADNGHTFRTVTTLGEQRRTYPEVNERLKVIKQIATYSRLLDLVPKKDKSKGNNAPAPGEEDDDW